jgi:hypothetical protein
VSAKFDINVKQGILYVRAKGEPTADEIIQVLKKLQDGSSYTHRLRLWDYRNADFKLDKGELERVSYQASKADGEPGKVAMLVNQDLAFGLARMYEVYRESAFTRVEVFRDESKAVAWLLEKEL